MTHELPFCLSFHLCSENCTNPTWSFHDKNTVAILLAGNSLEVINWDGEHCELQNIHFSVQASPLGFGFI